MKRVHSHCMTDEELRLELVARDTILFEVEGLSWLEIERQVERLGFDGCYIVSEVRGNAAGHARISLRPK
jgi:hypothetical protein